MRRRKCTKTRYATYWEAEAAIREMAGKYGAFVFKRPYRCGPCRGWHITSTPPPKARRKQW